MRRSLEFCHHVGWIYIVAEQSKRQDGLGRVIRIREDSSICFPLRQYSLSRLVTPLNLPKPTSPLPASSSCDRIDDNCSISFVSKSCLAKPDFKRLETVYFVSISDTISTAWLGTYPRKLEYARRESAWHRTATLATGIGDDASQVLLSFDIPF